MKQACCGGAAKLHESNSDSEQLDWGTHFAFNERTVTRFMQMMLKQ